MRISLRFILPLAIALAAIAYAVVPLVDRLTLHWFVRDLEIRAKLITNAAQEPLAALVREPRARQKILRFFDRIVQDERLFAVGFCDPAGKLAYATAHLPAERALHAADEAAPQDKPGCYSWRAGRCTCRSIRSTRDGEALGKLVLVHDMSFVQRRSEETKKYLFYLFVAHRGASVSLITVVIAEISWRGWVAGMKRADLRARAARRSPRRGARARAAADRARPARADARPRGRAPARATRASRTGGRSAARDPARRPARARRSSIVSNREPYIHVRTRNVIEVQRPASGLVTALEPVMRACSGTWIAHGSGSADRETVDAARPRRGAARAARRTASAASGSRKEEEAGLLLRLRQRGPVAAVPHRARAADLPRRRTGSTTSR